MILDTVMPQISIAIIEDDQGNEKLALEINTASVRVTAYLADKDNYRQAADKIAEGIRRMGAELKTPLITSVKGLPDGLRKKP